MAAPVDAGRATTNITASTGTWTVNLPASISAGDLLIMFARTSTAGVLTHADFTKFVDDVTDASNDRTFVFYKWATGSEGSTISVGCSSADKGAAIVWRITGAANPATRTPEIGTIAVGTGANPDPGSVTPTGGSKDYLFIEVGGLDGETQTFAASTNYSTVQNANSGTGGAAATNVRIGGATRQLTASSENPDAMTAGAPSAGWTALTIAIHPAGASEYTTSISLALTPAIAVVVTKETSTSLALSLTPAIAVNGVRETFTSATLPIPLAIGVNAVREAFASLATALGPSVTTVVTKETFARSALDLTPAISLPAALRETFTTINFPIPLEIAVNAVSSTGGTEHFASISFPMSLSIATAAGRETFSGISQNFSPTITIAAVRETTTGVTLNVGVNIGTIATREAFTSISRDISAAIAVAVTKETFASITDPLTLAISVNAVVEGQQVVVNRALLGVGK